MPPDAAVVVLLIICLLPFLLQELAEDIRRWTGSDEKPPSSKGAVRKLRHDLEKGKRIGPLHERILHSCDETKETDTGN